MIPITRKELYLNKIVGNDDYSVPEKPISEEEFFFAEILGEAVQAPAPLTRYQMYLAKIAGKNIEIPYPETRLEFFLAKAAGMNVTTPTPITRKEIYWSNYTAVVEFEVENVPPLTYKAIEGTLKNYRIYGNTVNGESVGDRTANLFDGELVNNYHIGQDGLPSAYSGRCCSTIPIPIKTESLVISYDTIGSLDTRCMYSVFLDGTLVRRATNIATGQTIDTSGGDELYIGFYLRFGGVLNSNDIFNIMLNTGSEPLPYEPCGYRVPVTVTNGTDTETTNFYLPEQIKMVGDEAEYIDYKEQKQHFADGTSVDVILPALPTLSGTNTLSVGTEVQPSKVYVKGEKEREYT